MAGDSETYAGPQALRVRWAEATGRAARIEQLAERRIDFQTVAAQAGRPDADPFDLLCYHSSLQEAMEAAMRSVDGLVWDSEPLP